MKSSRSKKITFRPYIIIVLLLGLAAFIYFYWAWAGKNHISAAAPKKITTQNTATPTISETEKLETAWKSIITTRQGLVDIALYDNTTGQTAHYANTTDTFDTASIVKFSILEAVLLQDQNSGQTITTSQMAEAVPMIENSDNDAASALWEEVGEASAMDSFFNQIGATATTAGLEDEWGLTQTTALDQLKVLNLAAYPGKTLSQSSASTINSLLSQVEADQRWGVSGGVPNGVTVQLKNGWLPDSETNDPYEDTNDWTINSIGFVKGGRADYTIAVLTEGNPSEQYGIDTIESLSTASWNTLVQNP